MKTKIMLFFMAVICSANAFVSCSQSAKSSDSLSKKAALETELAQKKAELGKLQFDVQQIEQQLNTFSSNTTEKQKSNNTKIPLVKTHTIQTKEFIRYAELQGNIETKGQYMASAEIGGVLRNLTVKENDFVQQGQLIGQTDGEMIKKAIEEIDLGISVAQDVFNRRQRLWDQKIGSEIEYIKTKNELETLQKKRNSLQLQLSKVDIYAPTSGIIDKVFIKQGEMAGPGMPILQILNTAKVQVVADVPETYLANVKKGNSVTIYLPALNIEKQATITNISPIINPNNRTFKIEINVPNSSGLIKPNLVAIVKLKEFSTPKAIIAPTNYIIHDGLDSYVYIVQKSDTTTIARKTKITTSESNATETIVTNGLKQNEVIITEGINEVNDGDAIITE